jgi:hypothetical protein
LQFIGHGVTFLWGVSSLGLAYFYQQPPQPKLGWRN